MNIIQSVDNTILQFIQLHMRNTILDIAMPLITSLGNKLTIWSIAGLILIASNRYRKYGYMIIFSLLLCLIVGNFSLKPLVARARPFDARPILDVLLISPPKDFSFPSGHTMSSFASAVIIYYMNRKAGICALILGTLIGFSRLYLYVHYPSDVFAGAIIGGLIGGSTIFIFKEIKKKNINKYYFKKEK